MPFAEGRPVTVGIFDLTNTGSSPVTIHGVRLGSPRGLTMTEAWLVPIEHFATYVSDVGAGAPFPPNDSPSGRWAWAHRRPAVGAVLRKHQDLNLVFGVIRTTARAGRSAGPVIVYSVSGGTYTVQEQTSLVVAAASC